MSKFHLYTVLFSCVIVSAGCDRAVHLRATELHMDTRITLQVKTTTARSRAARVAITRAFSAVTQVEEATSHFLDTSDPARLGRAAAGTPVHLHPVTWRALCIATQVHMTTRGTYDITLGPLVEIWGFGRKTHASLPTPHDITNAQRRVGMHNLFFSPETTSVYSRIDGIDVDLSSVAKGVGADAAFAVLTNSGFHTVLVNAGGDIRVGTAPAAPPWRIGIQVPRMDASDNEYLHDRVITLRNGAVATSGNYRRVLRKNSRVFSHIIDPVCGRPVTSDVVSVTVCAPTCGEADAWATGLYTVPPSDAIRYADALPHISCCIIRSTGDTSAPFRILSSAGFPATTESATP